jgi:integrase
MAAGGKRANGEGTIYQRKDGRWEAAVFVPTASGQRIRRRIYGKTRKEVRTKLTEVLRTLDQGLPVAISTETVEIYLNAWLHEVAKRRVRPRTFEIYELLIRRHIVPTLGRTRLDRLSARQVRQLLDGKIDEGLSGSTVRQIHAVLRVALEQAVREDMLPRNVARLVQPPAGPRRKVSSFSIEESRRLLATAKGDRMYALWAVALGIGLRKGEALGLRWLDIDFQAGTLSVTQSLQRIDGKLRVDVPKTRRSRRKVPLPSVCLDALGAHKAAQEQERVLLGRAWQESGLVFTTSLGTPVDPRNVNRCFDSLCDRAGVRRVRVHDLRRTCATILLAQNVPARVVMEILGHSQISITLDVYTDVLPSVKDEAARRMQDALTEPQVEVRRNPTPSNLRSDSTAPATRVDELGSGGT